MTFPNTKNKHLYDSFFSPAEYIKYLQQRNLLTDFKAPKGVLFIYSKRLQDKIAKGENFEQKDTFLKGSFLVSPKENVAVLNVGIGAPAITVAMEELIALGTKKFISIGTAGGIQKNLELADIIICDKAIRDEGVSHHYLTPEKYIEISSTLVKSLYNDLKKAGLRFKIGPTWTIDAPYKETVEELKNYQAEGVMAVDMEAAALAAVAKLRGVEFASALVISDLLGELEWNPQFQVPEVLENLYQLAEISIKILSK